jgi:tetratricopeptide (TPR) repeat protein
MSELLRVADNNGLLAAYDAQGEAATSVGEMQRRADIVRASDSAISDERGHALILLAARAASAGDYDRAVSAQSEAAQIANRLYGADSAQHSIATVNLGAIFFRAGLWAEAFENYRRGVIAAVKGGAPPRLWRVLNLASGHPGSEGLQQARRLEPWPTSSILPLQRSTCD